MNQLLIKATELSSTGDRTNKKSTRWNTFKQYIISNINIIYPGIMAINGNYYSIIHNRRF